jgi:ADP-dependent phosphofructokinase/glucokinase
MDLNSGDPLEVFLAYQNSRLKWFEEHARWSRLRAMGNSGIVKSSVLMPAFGYLLLLNDNVQHV